MALFSNQFHRLRAERLAESTRDFLARGKSVTRCEQCQMATYACLCPWRPTLESRCEFILLMHRNEVFKPTNTGRLIADALPDRTHVYCWSRTQPNAELLQRLQDTRRQCFIVFPADAANAGSRSRQVFSEIPGDDRIPTFILLDGTWKQSGRMFHLSQWLENIPCILLPMAISRGYSVRKSHQDDYLSTAEAAALCLQLAGEQQNSIGLLDYFQLFNEHYLATRGCYPPRQGELHKKLENMSHAHESQ
ncbi:MAG TPA: DTW domain-containing protein [Cellvibrio sp.]|nr:DTW domain-containing protein [Cellvibrio sp.]